MAILIRLLGHHIMSSSCFLLKVVLNRIKRYTVMVLHILLLISIWPHCSISHFLSAQRIKLPQKMRKKLITSMTRKLEIFHSEERKSQTVESKFFTKTFVLFLQKVDKQSQMESYYPQNITLSYSIQKMDRKSSVM